MIPDAATRWSFLETTIDSAASRSGEMAERSNLESGVTSAGTHHAIETITVEGEESQPADGV